MSAQPSRHELEARLIKKLWSDDDFRKAFEANPRAMTAKAMGVTEDQVPKIVLHQEAAGEWHIVVPSQPAASAELSDADLEQVAGGTTPVATVSYISLAISTFAQDTVESEGWA